MPTPAPHRPQAEAGDSATTQALLADFLKTGGITKAYTNVAGSNYNPTQRRNPGAPETAALEAQMGSMSYAMYAPKKNMLDKTVKLVQ